MVRLWRCEICGDPYIGESPPDNCPFCGAGRRYIKEARDAKVDFAVQHNDKDKSNAEHPMKLEIRNAAMYI